MCLSAIGVHKSMALHDLSRKCLGEMVVYDISVSFCSAIDHDTAILSSFGSIISDINPSAYAAIIEHLLFDYTMP